MMESSSRARTGKRTIWSDSGRPPSKRGGFVQPTRFTTRRPIVADLRRTVDPETVWNRFGGGKSGTARWYRQVYERLREVGFTAPIMTELDQASAELTRRSPASTIAQSAEGSVALAVGLLDIVVENLQELRHDRVAFQRDHQLAVHVDGRLGLLERSRKRDADIGVL